MGDGQPVKPLRPAAVEMTFDTNMVERPSMQVAHLTSAVDRPVSVKRRRDTTRSDQLRLVQSPVLWG